MIFSSPTFTTSSVRSNMDDSDSTLMSTSFQARSDLNNDRTSSLINEQVNFVN